MTQPLHGYVGLGGNLGDRRARLQQALDLMAGTGGLVVRRVSRLYESAPWGFDSERLFYNAVVELSWQGTLAQLRRELQRVEARGGRHHGVGRATRRAGVPSYADRPIDLDLLWLDGVTCETPELVLPHPRAHLRAFVLVPWCELAPDMLLHGRELRWWLAQLPAAEVDSVSRVEGPSLVLPAAAAGG